MSGGSYASGGSLEPENPPPKLSIRDKFKARCIERAVREREKVIRGKRCKHPVSDDKSMGDDESEDEEVIMGDEVSFFPNPFRRLNTYCLFFFVDLAFPENYGKC